jgi:glycosyltransferase involved in cell wall biosynthesis
VPESSSCDATVLITTKNRCDELQNALRSVVSQSLPAEILVIDDGSSDGTPAMLRREFPVARVIRHDESRGYIVRRNEGVREARGKIVISIDDDAAFSTPDVVRQTLAEFTDDRVGAIAMPYIDVNREPDVKQRAPDAGALYATDRFIGTAHALRRDVFLRVGGYRESLVHQGEEGDYCLRMLDAGFIVRLGRADPIHHFESPRRDFRRMDYFGVRNSVLFVWQNVPMPYLLWHLPAVMMRLALFTLQPGRLATRLSGMAAGLRLFASQPREPVSKDTYRLARSLAANPRTLPAEQLRPRASRT